MLLYIKGNNYMLRGLIKKGSIYIPYMTKYRKQNEASIHLNYLLILEFLNYTHIRVMVIITYVNQYQALIVRAWINTFTSFRFDQNR